MDKSWLDRDLIEKHSLDMRQFIDFRESTLPNGMRIIEAYNSSGLTFTLLPDRGMDIWSAHYKGMPLTWIAPNSPHPPDYGQSWLSLFNGGLLTTCGLTHVGPPEDGRDIHGNYTRLRATDIQKDMRTQVLRLSSTIHQSELFGEQIEVKRTYTLTLNLPQVTIYDEVTNIGDEPVPFMMLYHCNIGYPIVREGTELVLASDIYSRDEAAQNGVETWQQHERAKEGYEEQVFFHHMKTPKGEGHNFALAALLNETIGLNISWNTRFMPYLTQWKNTRQGIYVCGIEPGNCIPEGQNAAKDAERLVMLKPKEKQAFELSIEVIEGEDAIENCRTHIADLKINGSPVEHCNLSGYEKYTGDTE